MGWTKSNPPPPSTPTSVSSCVAAAAPSTEPRACRASSRRSCQSRGWRWWGEGHAHACRQPELTAVFTPPLLSSLPKCDAHDVPPADGSSLIDLPDDIVHMILTHLSTPADIAATAQTCKCVLGREARPQSFRFRVNHRNPWHPSCSSHTGAWRRFAQTPFYGGHSPSSPFPQSRFVHVGGDTG